LRCSLKNARDIISSRHHVGVRKNMAVRTKHRLFSTKTNPQSRGDGNENNTVAQYMGAIAVFVFGMAYASVPLYKVFCQMTGFGGTTQRVEESREDMEPVVGSKPLKVYFTAGVHSAMPWKFIPTQKEVRIVPGETALAFYTVKNTADYAITGVATYNVYPPKAGLYFSKIQCFCFEEQRLGPNEEIDMPVFFFIDPEFCKDPAMASVQNITLSYTFFKTGDERKADQKE
jgi:cytochrome c oxidase assembly protein subunit 11